ncbi:hypothetical protein CRENBAI_009004 [Crenichthys baileyi]|uniref:Uncharacterized protein n=1 Tax=Crenichthys baileyi TaxID=28760 RepID=A0AAV9SKY4_9TELE
MGSVSTLTSSTPHLPSGPASSQPGWLLLHPSSRVEASLLDQLLEERKVVPADPPPPPSPSLCCSQLLQPSLFGKESDSESVKLFRQASLLCLLGKSSPPSPPVQPPHPFQTEFAGLWRTIAYLHLSIGGR